MDVENIKQNFTVEILNSFHNLSNFDCGDEDLNDFIKNDALLQKNWKINVTHLIKYDNEIIGFFSILADSIKIDLLTIDDQMLKTKTDHIFAPAVKIGRFALDEKYAEKE